MRLSRSLVQLLPTRTKIRLHQRPTCWVRGNATSSTQDEAAVAQTNRAEVTMKRFWKTVGIEKHDGTIAVTLDSRPLKTPSGKTLLLPANKSLVATLVAAEWEHQEVMLKPHALPLTSLVARALDALAGEKTRTDVRASLLQYLETDTICFHQNDPPVLVALQSKHWDPLLNWARSTFGVKIHTFNSVLMNAQPPETKQKFDEVLTKFDHWEMAAMERATYATKSFIIALALVKGHLTVEQAALAAQVEVSSQIERWGEVEDTHDVDFHDVRRQLGAAACLLSHI